METVGWHPPSPPEPEPWPHCEECGAEVVDGKELCATCGRAGAWCDRHRCLCGTGALLAQCVCGDLRRSHTNASVANERCGMYDGPCDEGCGCTVFRDAP